ncbi:hypothetical protein ACTXT7_002571 [Hymenolepis weldensis]
MTYDIEDELCNVKFLRLVRHRAYLLHCPLSPRFLTFRLTPGFPSPFILALSSFIPHTLHCNASKMQRMGQNYAGSGKLLSRYNPIG